MKKKSYISTLLFLSMVFLITSCQKSITEQNTDVARAVPDASLENQCRLTRFTYPGFDNVFHYNEKGLADEWKIDYGFGFDDVYKMEYDNNNRLVKAQWYFDGSQINTINFIWTGNFITQEHWDFGGGFSFEVFNTYDKKGQLVKREDSYGLAGSAQYSPIGNLSVIEVGYNGELWEKHEMTHNIPNRNPFLAIRGLPYAFPFIMLPFNSKWWETSEKVTLYGGGDAYVIMDPDPAQTTFDFGSQHYLQQANYFDLATNSPLIVPFEYENCGGNETPTRSSNLSKNHSLSKRSNVPVPLRLGSPDFIKKQIERNKNK